MKHSLLGAFFALATVVFASSAAPVKAATMVTTPCGEYTFETQYIIDGLEIRATKGTMVKKTFIYHYGADPSVYSSSVSLAGCQDGKLAVVTMSSSKYSVLTTINLINPFGQSLVQEEFATVGKNTAAQVPDVYTPATAETTARTLIERSVVLDESPRAALVAKARAIAPQDILIDRSFYVFGKDNALVKRTANSYWGTTIEDSVTTCGDTTYRVYEKQFAERNTATSTFPMGQYVVMRTTPMGTTYLPIAYTDKSWLPTSYVEGRSSYSDGSLSVAAMRCVGNGMYISAGMRLMVVTPTTAKLDYRDTKKSIDFIDTYFDGQNYYESGKVNNNRGVITGSSSIKTLRNDGTVFETKPAYLRDITKTPDSWITFYKSPFKREDIVAYLVTGARPDLGREYAQESFSYRNGAYVKDDEWGLKLVRDLPWNKSKKESTPLYVKAEPGMIVVKSFWLDKPALIHQTPGKSPVIQWFTVGVMKADGSRDITYAFTVDGVRQIWKATVK